MELSRLMSDESGAKRQLEIEYGQPNKRTRFQLPIHPSAGPYIPQENEIICYGMLADDVIQFKRPPKRAELDVMTAKVYDDDRSYFEIDINLQDELGLGTLKITDDRDLGVLSTHTFRALKALHDKHNITFRSVIHEGEWEDKMEPISEKASWTRISVNAKLNVILFGPRLAGTDVAKILAKEGRFLQDPIPGSIDCSYENPQSLSLPEVEESASSQLETSLRNTVTTDEFALDDQEHHTNVVPQPDPVSLMDKLDTVMNNLPTDNNLPHVSVDSSVITKLLSHQQKGLDFISKREKGENIPDRSLWQKISDMEDEREECYQHDITGAKSPTPADCLGGIIADDMGLGKTLTMLSAIISSRNAAHAFGAQDSLGEIAKSTIVVVPSEPLLRTWANEINKHLHPEALRFIIYHGAERRQQDTNLRDHDIILTTYGTAMAEYRKRTGVLYRTTWYRLILDEAHMIRNSASKQFEAVDKIQSHIRWCLSGTPIQNSLEDLRSIVRFLSVPVLDNPATFRKYIFSEQAPGEPAGEPYQNLRRLLGSICLRRTMSTLPDMTYDTDHKRLDLAPTERQQYESMQLTLRRLITSALTQQQQGSTHRLKVMEAFLRLRMFCNNGLEESVNAGVLTPGSQPDEILSVLQQSGANLCDSCYIDVQAVNGPEDSDAGYLTRCFKVFCHECSVAYKERFRRFNSLTCPLCEKDHGIDDLINADMSTTTSGTSSQYPTKIKALVDDVQVNYLKGKCVIFSFWKRTLNVVAKAFKDHDIKFSRIDGDVTPKKRNTILAEFQTRVASRVLIMTFSTGGVGLNGLTVADRIHILEPQWNPAVEKQAIGRVLRLDQRKRVTVVRYVMRKTIEEAVQSQQQRKIQIAGGGFANDRDQRDLKVNQLMQLGNLLNTSIEPDR